ncbi:MAG TPA: amino acid permease [Gemmatimonadales bacterium]
MPRRIGAWSTLAVVVGIMVGSGIFRVPATVAAYGPSVFGFIAIWVVGGLLATSGALVFGELAALFPVTGGRFVYLKEGLSPSFAFIYAWTFTLLLRPSGNAAMGLVFAAYAGSLVPALAPHEHLVAGTLIVVLSLANYASVPLTISLSNAGTLAKVLALGALAIGILIWAPTVAPAATTVSPPSLHGYGLALVTVMWTYSGWSSATDISGEVRNAQRAMPMMLVLGVSAVTALFVLVNVALLHAMPMTAIAASKAVVGDAAALTFGAAGRTGAALLVVVATFSALNSTTLAAPRLIYALGEEMPRLRTLAGVHSAYRTPYVAVVLTMVLSVVFLLNHSFEQMANLFILGSWPFYILCGIALFRLRRTRPDVPRPFRVPWYPWMPVVFLVSSSAMLVNALVADPWHSAMGAAFVLLGFPVYYLLRTPK